MGEYRLNACDVKVGVEIGVEIAFGKLLELSGFPFRFVSYLV